MQTIGARLAIRQEGNWVNAYLASTETMKDARPLGSILRGIVEKNPDIWEQWKALMIAAMQMGIEDVYGAQADMVVVEQAAHIVAPLPDPIKH